MQGSAWIRVTTTGVPATARPGHRRHLTQVSVGKIRPVTTFVARAPRKESSSALWSRPAQRRLLHHRSRQQLGTPPAAPRPTPRADHLQARLELCQRRAAPQRQRPTQRPTHRQQQRAPQPDRATQRRPPAAGHGVNPQSGPGGQHETTPPSSSAAPAPTHHDGLTRPGLDHWGHAEPAIPSQAIARWMWRSPNPTSARDRIAPARGGRTPPTELSTPPDRSAGGDDGGPPTHGHASVHDNKSAQPGQSAIRYPRDTRSTVNIVASADQPSPGLRACTSDSRW